MNDATGTGTASTPAPPRPTPRLDGSREAATTNMGPADEPPMTAGTSPMGVAPQPRSRLSETNRLEAFSDGVLSITITLLVFEVTRPEYEPGRLLGTLVAQWPAYVAFLASFLYVGIIWLNHRSVFAQVASCDRGLHWANLMVLLTTALLPFPTAVVSKALQNGDPFDERIAVALYALVAGFMCLAWFLLFHYLRSRPRLLRPDVDPSFFPSERLRAWVGVGSYAVAGVLGWAVEPRIALAIFLVLPIFYGTSEGLRPRIVEGDTGP